MATSHAAGVTHLALSHGGCVDAFNAETTRQDYTAWYQGQPIPSAVAAEAAATLAAANAAAAAPAAAPDPAGAGGGVSWIVLATSSSAF